MSKIEIVVGEPEANNSEAELLEIKEELAEHIEATGEALEETAEVVENELEGFKEEVKSWLEKALHPIATAILSLSELTGTLAMKVEAMEQQPQLIPPILEAETLSETNTETLNSSETEPPQSEEAENPVVAEVSEALDNPMQSIARVITKL